MCVCIHSHVLSNSATLWTVAYQSPLSMSLGKNSACVTISFSRESSQLWDGTGSPISSILAGRLFAAELREKPNSGTTDQ